jgi:hypothetical protein
MSGDDDEMLGAVHALGLPDVLRRGRETRRPPTVALRKVAPLHSGPTARTLHSAGALQAGSSPRGATASVAAGLRLRARATPTGSASGRRCRRAWTLRAGPKPRPAASSWRRSRIRLESTAREPMRWALWRRTAWRAGAKRGSQRLGRPAVPGHDTPTELHHVRPVARARGAQMSAAAATRRGSGAQPASRPDMRALPRAHRAPAPHRRCMPAPEDEEMAEFMLVGDQGRKNGATSSSLSFCGPKPSDNRPTRRAPQARSGSSRCCPRRRSGAARRSAPSRPPPATPPAMPA